MCVAPGGGGTKVEERALEILFKEKEKRKKKREKEKKLISAVKVKQYRLALNSQVST